MTPAAKERRGGWGVNRAFAFAVCSFWFLYAAGIKQSREPIAADAYEGA